MIALCEVSRWLADCHPFPFVHLSQFWAVENKKVFPVFLGPKGPIIRARYDLCPVDHDELIVILVFSSNDLNEDTSGPKRLDYPEMFLF